MKTIKKLFSTVFGKSKNNVLSEDTSFEQNKTETAEERLKELKDLYEKDLISQEEYKTSKKEILKKM